MRYFLVNQSEQLINPLVIDGLDPQYYKYNISDKDWERIPNVIVAYFKNSPYVESSEVLNAPTLLIGNKMKELFALYDNTLEFKAIQVFSDKIEDRMGFLYWVLKCKEVDCLHESCKVYPNGMVEEIRLEHSKLPKEPIFKIGSIVQNTLVVSFPVAESILRRNWLGVGLKEIEVL